MDSLDDVLLDAEEKMEKTRELFQSQLAGVRTGRASPALVENVRVVYYGAPTRIREVASISTPEPRLIVISPYDPTALAEIEKGILAANIGVTPMSDGRVVRVPIPELSQERRKEMIKVVRRMAEEGRVAVRNVRRDANDAIKKLQKDGKITEDERDKGLGDIQRDTDAEIAQIDKLAKAKEDELMVI